jgi:hypothetical protein
MPSLLSAVTILSGERPSLGVSEYPSVANVRRYKSRKFLLFMAEAIVRPLSFCPAKGDHALLQAQTPRFQPFAIAFKPNLLDAKSRQRGRTL